jgi:hypothetical protein
MHPECSASLSIVENLIQYYPISPGPVAVTLRMSSRTIMGHVPQGAEPAIVVRDGAETPAIYRSHHP